MNRHELIRNLEAKHLKANVADVRVGETVKVHYKIREGNKERVQIFEGLVIATKAGQTIQGSFTVRKVVAGIGVERTFPLHSPWIVKIDRVKSGKVRRAKLNFVRERVTSSRFKLKDKGLAGATWDQAVDESADETTEIAVAPNEEPAEIKDAETPETEELAVEGEVADNATDEPSEQTVGDASGDAGSEPAATEEAPDSSPEPTN